MSFALLGIIAVVALVALVAIFMSVKNWHWGQMLLVLGVYLFGLIAMFLSAEVLRIHNALRSQIPGLETSIGQLEDQNQALRHGTEETALINQMFDESPFDESVEEMPGIDELNHELQLSARRQGRVWSGVVPTGGLQNNQVAVAIPEGQPPLSAGAIVYVFEMGPPNGANPAQGSQYLGEFSVESAAGANATLQSVRDLTRRTGQRLETSRGPWRVYETMPSDRHALFADLNEQQLRALLPAMTVEQYLRHDGPVTQDDDEYEIAGFDEEGRRVAPDQIGSAAERRYDRPLRSYAYLFEELARQRVLLVTELRATAGDIKALETANQLAEGLSAYRKKEIEQLTQDLKAMQRDREVIASHLEGLQKLLQRAQSLRAEALEANQQLAEKLTEQQTSQLQALDAPAGGVFTSP